MATFQLNPWLVCLRQVPKAQYRLFCIPFAGGDFSIFLTWPDFLPPQAEVFGVELPGSLRRMSEKPLTDMEPLVDGLARALLPHLDLPFAIFGSCTGSFSAFELVLKIRALCGREPAHLYCSSVWAPHLPSRHPPIHRLPKKDFIQSLDHLGAIPRETLAQPELVQVLLPAIRADFKVAETYTPVNGAQVHCPLTTFCGTNDPMVLAEEAAAWEEETTGPFQLLMLEGDHNLWKTSRETMLSTIKEDMRTHLDTNRENILI